MICVEIDGLTPCLIDNTSGESIETEAIRVKSKSFLSTYNKTTGWYINWASLLDSNEIYALVLKENVSVQGLIALHRDDVMQATFIDWAVANPHSNSEICENKEYSGIGGHLFAIAVDKSIQQGFGGAVTGFAANKRLLEYYVHSFNAEFVGVLHPYQIFINEANARKIKEEYTYEWIEDQL